MKFKLWLIIILLSASHQVFAQSNAPSKLLVGDAGLVGYTIHKTKPTQEIQLDALFIYPEQDEFWGHGTAIETQWRFWADYLGVTFMIGLSRWEADVNGPTDLIDADDVHDVMLKKLNEDIDALNAQAAAEAAAASSDDGTVTPSVISSMSDVSITSFSIDGDAYYLPMGISFTFKPTMYKMPFEVAVEAGVRYFFVLQDDINVETKYTDPSGQYSGTTSTGVSLKEGLVGVLAVDMGYEIIDGLDLFFGAGYQFDLQEGTATWADGKNLLDVKLGGSIFRIGMQFNY